MESPGIPSLAKQIIPNLAPLKTVINDLLTFLRLPAIIQDFYNNRKGAKIHSLLDFTEICVSLYVTRVGIVLPRQACLAAPLLPVCPCCPLAAPGQRARCQICLEWRRCGEALKCSGNKFVKQGKEQDPGRKNSAKVVGNFPRSGRGASGRRAPPTPRLISRRLCGATPFLSHWRTAPPACLALAARPLGISFPGREGGAGLAGRGCDQAVLERPRH